MASFSWAVDALSISTHGGVADSRLSREQSQKGPGMIKKSRATTLAVGLLALLASFSCTTPFASATPLPEKTRSTDGYVTNAKTEAINSANDGYAYYQTHADFITPGFTVVLSDNYAKAQLFSDNGTVANKIKIKQTLVVQAYSLDSVSIGSGPSVSISGTEYKKSFTSSTLSNTNLVKLKSSTVTVNGIISRAGSTAVGYVTLGSLTTSVDVT